MSATAYTSRSSQYPVRISGFISIRLNSARALRSTSSSRLSCGVIEHVEGGLEGLHVVAGPVGNHRLTRSLADVLLALRGAEQGGRAEVLPHLRVPHPIPDLHVD